jgi:hypothetical protein
VICFLAGATPAAGQISAVSTPSYTVAGIVADGGGNGIDKAEVTISTDKTVLQAVTTGPDGRFSLGSFPAGNATLHVRRIGYEQQDMKITIGGSGHSDAIQVLLRELPQKLEEVLVKSDEEGRLKEFYDHKNKRNNFGRYFDRAEIRKQNPSYASELLRSVPGTQVQASSLGGNLIRMRGCRPLVWVDGQRSPGAELDEVTRPADIAGLEVYSSNAGIPAEYMDRNNGACGIIVVWTKSQ